MLRQEDCAENGINVQGDSECSPCWLRSFISTHSGSLLLKGKAITEFTEPTLDLSEAKTQTGRKKDSVTNARIIGPIGGRCLALIFFNLPEPSGM